jgi:hypothetical protein
VGEDVLRCEILRPSNGRGGGGFRDMLESKYQDIIDFKNKGP